MILVHPEHEFLMGSPVTEPGRRDGPANIHEALHQRSVGRHFAIASHEVTVAQFKAFREKHGSDRDISRDLDAPVRALTCYDTMDPRHGPKLWISQ